MIAYFLPDLTLICEFIFFLFITICHLFLFNCLQMTDKRLSFQLFLDDCLKE